jgi:hypothetical protein
MIKSFFKKKLKVITKITSKATNDSQLKKYRIQEILGAGVVYLYLQLPKIEEESEGTAPSSYFDSKYWLENEI